MNQKRPAAAQGWEGQMREPHRTGQPATKPLGRQPMITVAQLMEPLELTLLTPDTDCLLYTSDAADD